MNTTLIFILALLLPCYAQAEKPMTEAEFTADFLLRLKDTFPEANFEKVTDLKISTQNLSGYQLNIFLGNAYDTYQAGARGLERIYQDQLASINSQKTAFANSDVKSILPVIKPATYLETVKRQLKEAGYSADALPFYYETLNDDLIQVYAFDSETSMRLVSPDDVNEYRIKDSIAGIASTNLAQHYERIGAQVREVDTNGNGRLYVFRADENYEASILAAFGFLNRPPFDNNKTWVVFIPARNIALIADAADTKAVALAANIAAQGYKELGYSISPYGYIKTNHVWVRLQL